MTGRVLLTGATGYIGSRLLPELERRGFGVRALVRRPERLRGRTGSGTEVVRGDVLDPSTLGPALEGTHTAYYLVHSMDQGSGFEDLDRKAAQGFARAARQAGLRRVVYLGGLGSSADGLSAHLRSRQEVGEILRAEGPPTIELRTSIVLGCGSTSFEMIRALVERLPVMVTPRWVGVACQPIGIDDLLRFLLGALDLAVDGSLVLEIGGADRVSYGELMRAYARARGLRRLLIPVPVLSPRLSSLWLALVTPYYAAVGRKLVSSLRNPTVVRDDRACELFGFRPVGVEAAVARALETEERELDGQPWSRSIPEAAAAKPRSTSLVGTRIVDSRFRRSRAAPGHAFRPIRRIGGARGWYYGNAMWRLRGLLDRLLGGAGMSGGRKDPERLAVGDRVDGWRVVAFEPDRRLRLEAGMKLPGRAWLEFEVEPDGAASLVRQSAVFDSRGLLGLLYWYALVPIHHLMFDGMLKAIVREGEEDGATPGPHARRAG